MSLIDLIRLIDGNTYYLMAAPNTSNLFMHERSSNFDRGKYFLSISRFFPSFFHNFSYYVLFSNKNKWVGIEGEGHG